MCGKWCFCLVFLVLFLFFGAGDASAIQFESGEMFVLMDDEVVADDLLVVAAEVRIDGKIDGDLIALGGNVFVSGVVEGDIIVLGGSVDIDGDVSDDLLLVAAEVKISGDVGDNLLGASGTFRMTDEGSVGRDVVLASGVVGVDGDVGRDLDVRGGNVVIAGEVLGNVSIDVGDADVAPRIMTGARIGGDVLYVSEKDIVIDEGAFISGSVDKMLPSVDEVKSDFYRFNEWLGSFLSIFIVGFILVRLFPVHTCNVCNQLKVAPLKSGFWGILGLIVVPVVSLFLLISIIGIPLALIMLVSYVILIYVAKVYLSVFVGKFLLSLGGSKIDSLVLMLVLGLLLFEVVNLVPVLGGFVGFFVVVFGFGALVIAEKEMYRVFRKKKMI